MDETHAASASPSAPTQDGEGPLAEALERRLSAQSRALVTLAKLEPGLDPLPAFHRITELTVETLATQRASVWLYDEGRTAIRCLDLFERVGAAPGRHSAGGVLEKELFPAYFAALDEERTIAAHDVAADARVREFLDAYLVPLGITSMLDAPVRTEGRLAGVLCCEHVGPGRTWTWDEQNFVGAVGDLVALAMESSERRREAHRLAEQMEVLRTRLSATLQLLRSGDASGAAGDQAGEAGPGGRLQIAAAELQAILVSLGA